MKAFSPDNGAFCFLYHVVVCMNKFKDKVVVITGATSGIGRECAAQFAARGAKVVSLARHESGEYFSVCADISDEAAVNAAVARVTEQFGTIDILVNNAGFGISGAIENTSDEDARRIFDVNFFGTLNLIKAVVPVMRRGGGGSIVNISSVAGELAIPFQSFYSPTKAAVCSLSAALRNEVAPFNIRVSAVLPGDVNTGFTSARRKNSADDPAYGDRVARAVAAMERDEQNGMPPAVVARAVLRCAAAKRPPVQVSAGAKYGLFLFLAKLLPLRLVNYILGKMYS